MGDSCQYCILYFRLVEADRLHTFHCWSCLSNTPPNRILGGTGRYKDIHSKEQARTNILKLIVYTYIFRAKLEVEIFSTTSFNPLIIYFMSKLPLVVGVVWGMLSSGNSQHIFFSGLSRNTDSGRLQQLEYNGMYIIILIVVFLK